MVVKDIPSDYLRITSRSGSTAPAHLLVCPFLLGDRVTAVVETGSFETFTKDQLELLKIVSESVSISITSMQKNEEVQNLLIQTQSQAEELQAQQEELRATNESLLGKTRKLEHSEKRLQVQQEELQVTNEEWEMKTFSLRQQTWQSDTDTGRVRKHHQR